MATKSTQSEIIVYKTEYCSWCHKTVEFLKENKIKFKEIDVSENEKAAEAMVEKSGQYGVPVIDINGEIIIGYDVEALKKALKIKN